MAQRSNRSQFIKRIVQFYLETKLRIRLIYYPPYHSKYNPIERGWAIWENSWNGAIFESKGTGLSWASNLTWKGNHPQIHLIEENYEKGITVKSSELEFFQQFWQSSESLPKWDVTISSPANSKNLPLGEETVDSLSGIRFEFLVHCLLIR